MKDFKDNKLIGLSEEAYNKAKEKYPSKMVAYEGADGEVDINLMPRMFWAEGYDAALKEHNLV